MDRLSLKRLAKEQIKNRIGILFLCQIIIVATSLICNIIPVIGNFAYILILPTMQIGFCLIFLGMTEHNDPDPAMLFSRLHDFWKNFCLNFFLGLFVTLWSLLLVIPGIVKGYSYAMSYYILADHPEIGSLEAITRSREMMNGHKMELFILQLSFLPWILLTLITCGIASIYVTPYMSATMANYYRTLSGARPTMIDNSKEFPSFDI